MSKKLANITEVHGAPPVEPLSNADAIEMLRGLFGAARYLAASLHVFDATSHEELLDAIAVAQLTLLRLEASDA